VSRLGARIGELQRVHLAAGEAIRDPTLARFAALELGKGGNDLIIDIHWDSARHLISI
jgi:hypothetical protein